MSADIVGPVQDRFESIVTQMIRNSSHPSTIGPETVYQKSNLENRRLIHQMIEQLLKPGSSITGIEHLDSLHQRAQTGTSCLILMEHYSNFDIPALYYLLEREGRRDVAESIIAIAGVKLNEDSGFVKAFTEAYTRIVIYPSRSIASISDPKELEREMRRSREINMAATRQMIRQKHQGRLILVFPSGTRYRPGRPETKRGVKEVSSYIRSFDSMVFIAIAGNLLHIHPSGNMKEDLLARDLVAFNVSEPISCEEFREESLNRAPAGSDPKQFVADRVMQTLESLHSGAEKTRAASLGS